MAKDSKANISQSPEDTVIENAKHIWRPTFVDFMKDVHQALRILGERDSVFANYGVQALAMAHCHKESKGKGNVPSVLAAVYNNLFGVHFISNHDEVRYQVVEMPANQFEKAGTAVKYRKYICKMHALLNWMWYLESSTNYPDAAHRMINQLKQFPNPKFASQNVCCKNWISLASHIWCDLDQGYAKEFERLFDYYHAWLINTHGNTINEPLEEMFELNHLN
jgi:hypothetical protein